MSKQIVATDQAPAAVGPYSQAVCVGGLVFTAGQVGLDPTTGKLAGEDIASQTRQTLQNLREILKAGGACLCHAVKTTVYLAGITDFKAMNEVYAEFFPEAPPARATLQAAALPLGALVEIEVVAEACDCDCSDENEEGCQCHCC